VGRLVVVFENLGIIILCRRPPRYRIGKREKGISFIRRRLLLASVLQLLLPPPPGRSKKTRRGASPHTSSESKAAQQTVNRLGGCSSLMPTSLRASTRRPPTGAVHAPLTTAATVRSVRRGNTVACARYENIVGTRGLL